MDKRLIKVRRATRLVVTERHVLASVDSPFITGLKYELLTHTRKHTHTQ